MLEHIIKSIIELDLVSDIKMSIKHRTIILHITDNIRILVDTSCERMKYYVEDNGIGKKYISKKDIIHALIDRLSLNTVDKVKTCHTCFFCKHLIIGKSEELTPYCVMGYGKQFHYKRVCHHWFDESKKPCKYFYVHLRRGTCKFNNKTCKGFDNCALNPNNVKEDDKK